MTIEEEEIARSTMANMFDICILCVCVYSSERDRSDQRKEIYLSYDKILARRLRSKRVKRSKRISREFLTDV
jgi:hypothetical protein